MSFQASAIRISVEGGSILKAVLRTDDGGECQCEMDLNQYIGNNNGNFEWGGVNFANTAQNITCNLEGGDQVPVLRADLQDVDGNYHPRDINLGERIQNDNGELRFD